MLCQLCLKRTARFHLQRIVENELVEIHLCRECIDCKDTNEHENGLADKLNSLLEGLLHSSRNDKDIESSLSCNTCKTTLKEYTQSGLVGCSQCYDVFSKVIFINTGIKEKTYSVNKKLQRISEHIQNLQKELNKAVELEQFEIAAELRDEIQKYEQEGSFRDN